MIPMPKTRRSFERALLNAFSAGMSAGYGNEHTDLMNEEKRTMIEYLDSYKFKYSYDDLRFITPSGKE